MKIKRKNESGYEDKLYKWIKVKREKKIRKKEALRAKEKRDCKLWKVKRNC